MGRPVCGKRSSRAVIAAPEAHPDARISRDLTSAGCSVSAKGGRYGKRVSMLMQSSSGASESVGEYGMDVQVSAGLGTSSCGPSASRRSEDRDRSESGSSASDTDAVSKTSAALDANPSTEGASRSKMASHSCCVQCEGRGKSSCISVRSESCAGVSGVSVSPSECSCTVASDLRS